MHLTVPDMVGFGIAGIEAGLVAQSPKPEQIADLVREVEIFSPGKLLIAAILVAAGVVASRVIQTTLDRLGEGNARRRLLMKKVGSIARVLIFALTAYLVVMTFFDPERDRTALLGLGGTLAVALGFALKDVASSLVAGILILIDQPFQVGDRVRFGETYGEVTEIGLRAVRIVTLDDDEVSIPNNKFLTETVASANAGSLDMMVTMPFHIAATEDFELAKRLIYEACTTSKYVYLEKPVRVELEEEEIDSGICTTLNCKAYVIDTRYEKAFLTDVTERVKRAFRAHRIKHPYSRSFRVGNPEHDEYLPVSQQDRGKFRSPIAAGPEWTP